MKYIAYDPTNPGDNITGYYDPELHAPPAIPASSIEVTDSVWLDCINNAGYRRIDPVTKTVTSYTPPGPDDWQIVAAAESLIDSLCDAAYTASVSRTARYERKLDEAIRYRAADYPHPVAETDYPYLVRESIYRTESKHALADIIIARAEAFNNIGSAAEAARAELPAAIAAASSPAAKQAAADTIVDRIRTLDTTMEQ
ncbi:MAG: hypothetical protein ABW168_00390 [Sedimenticola sp.]